MPLSNKKSYLEERADLGCINYKEISVQLDALIWELYICIEVSKEVRLKMKTVREIKNHCAVFYVYVTVHCNKFLYSKTN